MRSWSRISRLLIAVICGSVLASGCSVYDAPLPGGPDVGDKPMKVTLMFRDVLDLVPQSTVKVDDVTVGKVTAVTLKGYVAKVTIELPRDVDLPGNAYAQIRQTSLLGEKFVDLSEPRDPSSDKLADGDVIGLGSTGRNPEVEEVFGALALLLNGGGVGQLKTITSELGTAFDGRESEVKSVLDQIRVFTGTLDDNKATIVTALENTNRLAVQLRKQEGTIKATLDDVPEALASINRQRDDLVKLLKALTRLSGVGVRVIQASKESTINSLRDLAPVLEGFAKAGQNFPKSLQVYLTYPFVDEAVGRDPQVARNLHMGDYTNLEVRLDLDLGALPSLPDIPGLPGEVCDPLSQLQEAALEAATTAVDAIPDNPVLTDALKERLINRIARRLVDEFKRQCQKPDAEALAGTAATILQELLQLPAFSGLLGAINDLPGGLGGVIGGLTEGLPTSVPTVSGNGLTGALGGLNRATLGRGFQDARQIDPFGLQAKGYDPGVGTLLFQGVATQR